MLGGTALWRADGLVDSIGALGIGLAILYHAIASAYADITTSPEYALLLTIVTIVLWARRRR